MYNAIFHRCQHVTLPATKAQTKHQHKAEANINVVLRNDLPGGQSSVPVCKQQNIVRLSNISSHPPT